MIEVHRSAGLGVIAHRQAPRDANIRKAQTEERALTNLAFYDQGAAHLAGKGAARDPVEALHWLLRAEAGGAGELVVGFLREAQAHAKPSQRAEAARRAAEPLS